MIVRRLNLVTFYTILIVLSLIAGRQKQAEAGESSSSSSPNEDSDNNDTNIQDDEQSGCEVDLFRLPARIQPVHYDLLVMPDLASNSFEGAIQISLSIGNYNNKSNNFNESVDSLLAPNQIALHASKYLSLDHVWYLEQRNKSSAAPKVNRDANNTLHQLLSETKQQANRTDLVGNDAGAYIEVVKVCRVPNFDMIIVSLAQDLRPNSMGLLHFTFSGDLSADTFGVYLSSWSAPAGAAKVSGGRQETNGSNVVSQFEATSAREMFPCFDEPEIKATFELSLIHRANKTALANTLPTHEHMLRMPVLSVTSANGPTAAKNATKSVQEEEEEEEFRLVRYARTPPMSAYLLAFTVGDYEFIEDFVQLKSKKLRVRVYTTPGEINKAQFALQTATKAIKVLQKMFDDEYPLDKIDLVGVVDLRFEAMGNWGLIMVKQQELLVDPVSSSAYGRASTASLIIHELAHQWSGNLVTMRWWNDLWQHEGFTAWMENKILGEVYPELEQSQLFEQSRANNSGAGKETKMRVPNSLSHVIAHLFNSQKPAASSSK